MVNIVIDNVYDKVYTLCHYYFIIKLRHVAVHSYPTVPLNWQTFAVYPIFSRCIFVYWIWQFPLANMQFCKIWVMNVVHLDKQQHSWVWFWIEFTVMDRIHFDNGPNHQLIHLNLNVDTRRFYWLNVLKSQAPSQTLRKFTVKTMYISRSKTVSCIGIVFTINFLNAF